MKTLVTGGAGFIGSHVVDALVDEGNDVICIDSLDPGVYSRPPDYLNPKADYCVADLRAWRPDERFADVECVVHLAALGGVGRAGKEPANVLQANLGGTAVLIEAMQSWPRLEKVVLASSFSVYGAAYEYECGACGARRNGERRVEDLEAGRYEVLCAVCGSEAEVLPLAETAVPNPLERYGASKYMQELAFRGFDACPVHILRQSSVYGERLRLDDGEATIIAKLAGWIGRHQRPKLYEDGRQIRDWVHVSDSVAAVLALLATGDGPPVINVCTGTPTTLLEACQAIARAQGVDVEPEIVGGYRPGDMRHCLGDPTVLERLVGRKPLSFAEGSALTFGLDAR